MSHGETIIRKVHRGDDRGTPTPRRPRELPHDLMVEATKRLRAVTIVFAITFFLADYAIAFVEILGGRPWNAVFGRPAQWGSGIVAIAASLVLFALITSKRVAPRTLLNIGLVYQVVGSFGIAMAEYWGMARVSEPQPPETLQIGLSWVAVWMLLFTIVVPNTPWKSLLAAAGSGASVPIVFLLTMRYGGTVLPISEPKVLFIATWVYGIVVLMSYFGARVVHKLGTEVGRARELGSYRLLERLGKGGMGEVWRASHRMLARPAAVKLIRPEALAESSGEQARVMLARFEREAQATAALTSAHTVELFDFGVTEEGIFYYVMELLDGLDLQELVRRHGPLPAARVIHFLQQVCESLEEAHAKGLIHRDIKPANIYSCRSGSRFDFVKVLDFGLVTRGGVITGTEIAATLDEHSIAGTPAYMPPEMARGGPIDGRADLYALGCVAFYLLTGRTVFEGATPMDVILSHASKTPEPPSGLAELPVPPELDAVVAECLAKEPDQRLPTARLLAQRLRAIPVEPWTQEQAQRWWERHREGGVESRDEVGNRTGSADQRSAL